MLRQKEQLRDQNSLGIDDALSVLGGQASFQTYMHRAGECMRVEFHDVHIFGEAHSAHRGDTKTKRQHKLKGDVNDMMPPWAE